MLFGSIFIILAISTEIYRRRLNIKIILLSIKYYYAVIFFFSVCILLAHRINKKFNHKHPYIYKPC